MKIKHEIIAMIAIAVVAAVFLAGCTTISSPYEEGSQAATGFNGPLKLVAKYKPLHLYVYADVTPTNQHPDFVIFQRFEPLVIADNQSNTVEIIFGEKGFQGQLATTYDYQDRVLKRYYCTSKRDYGQTNYFYFDKNGNGQWNELHTCVVGTNTDRSKSYILSNSCWMPKFKE